MEVHTHIQTVVAAQAEVVAFQGVDRIDVAPFIEQAFVNLCAERAAVAAAEDPCATEVETVAELMLHGDAEVVTAVVFGGKHLPLVEDHTFTVELSLGVCPGVADPARCLAEAALHKQLYTVGPAFAHTDFLIPALRRAEE